MCQGPQGRDSTNTWILAFLPHWTYSQHYFLLKPTWTERHHNTSEEAKEVEPPSAPAQEAPHVEARQEEAQFPQLHAHIWRKP